MMAGKQQFVLTIWLLKQALLFLRCIDTSVVVMD
jgi:hypothetical protein